MLNPGNTVGSCIVQAPLGVGGMAVVYRGWDPSSGRPVAIKCIKRELAAKGSIRAHFEHGAAALAALQHTHIVRIFDIIITADTLATVMELVEGLSLEEVLQREVEPPWNTFEAMAVMSPVLSAMAYAHRVGIIHRDLKPGNILLDRASNVDWPGVPKVIDFDLVKTTRHVVGSDVRAGTRMGTVPYMAPEQYFGRPDLDARADVFALGVILRQLLTGLLPADPHDERQVRAFYEGAASPPPLRSLVPDISHTTSDAIHAAMAIDEHQRPATAAELLALLGSQWGSSPPIHQASQPPHPHSQPPPTPHEDGTSYPPSDPDMWLDSADLDTDPPVPTSNTAVMWIVVVGGGMLLFFLLVLAMVS